MLTNQTSMRTTFYYVSIQEKKFLPLRQENLPMTMQALETNDLPFPMISFISRQRKRCRKYLVIWKRPLTIQMKLLTKLKCWISKETSFSPILLYPINSSHRTNTWSISPAKAPKKGMRSSVQKLRSALHLNCSPSKQWDSLVIF